MVGFNTMYSIDVGVQTCKKGIYKHFKALKNKTQVIEKTILLSYI